MLTTDVTITQNATANDFKEDGAAGTAEVSTVTFGSLKAGEKAIISAAAFDGTDLTFTASKDLTAAEVAAAFANLIAADKQSATGITANGYFTGTLDTGWTSGAVSGSSVTFTAASVGNQANKITVSAKLADRATNTANVTDFQIASKTDGTAPVASTTVTVTEDFGNVVVDDNVTKSITTITLDGFAGATLGAAAAATSLDKLATLNLANGSGIVALNSTVTTLALTLDGMAAGSKYTDAGLTTLNLTTKGSASDVDFTLANATTVNITAGANLDVTGGTFTAAKTVAITGSGNVTLVDISTNLETLTASAATGAISATVDGTIATVTTGSGNDSITVDTATQTKDINLGFGDDTLTYSAATMGVPTGATAGGEGIDTIKMTFASAQSLDGNTNFATAISSFERLTISDKAVMAADADITIDLEALGFSYVTLEAGTDDTEATNPNKLILNNMATGGTLVMNAAQSATAAQASTQVNVKNAATGTEDVLNIITVVDAANVDAGSITVNNVEAINITATDSSTDGVINLSTLNLLADKAKTVTVDGSANLKLTTTTAADLATINASAMTGNLEYTAAGATTGTTVIAGSGNDKLTASGLNDVLKGGEGSDTFYAGQLTTVYGGDGADKFYFATPTDLANVSTIADLGSGDTIYLVDNDGSTADDIVHTFYAAGAQYNPNTADFGDKLIASLTQTGAGESTWFQHGKNTYIVIDNKAGGDLAAGVADTYTAGKDVVIEITGLVDLSTASFNATTGSLEIA